MSVDEKSADGIQLACLEPGGGDLRRPSIDQMPLQSSKITDSFLPFCDPNCLINRTIVSFRRIDHSHPALAFRNVVGSARNNMDMQMRNRLPRIAPDVYAYIESSDLIILAS